jgi:ABC-type multidrug transport system fused ATPase/permease subunit
VLLLGGGGCGKVHTDQQHPLQRMPPHRHGAGVKEKLGTFLQTPFIMNKMVRENILSSHLGRIDKECYQLALKVCLLGHNLKLLLHGDKTEIRKKRITLLGGQKVRVALARAVYHDSNIYLLEGSPCSRGCCKMPAI